MDRWRANHQNKNQRNPVSGIESSDSQGNEIQARKAPGRRDAFCNNEPTNQKEKHNAKVPKVKNRSSYRQVVLDYNAQSSQTPQGFNPGYFGFLGEVSHFFSFKHISRSRTLLFLVSNIKSRHKTIKSILNKHIQGIDEPYLEKGVIFQLSLY
jgi:ribosomal protein S30